MRITFHNDDISYVGAQRGWTKQYNFGTGETLVGDISLADAYQSDGETRVIYLKFTTSTGGKFEVGDSYRSQIRQFPTRGGFLSGFYGKHSTHYEGNVDQLGVYLWKPISFWEIVDVRFGSLANYASRIAPHELVHKVYCNDGPNNITTVAGSTVENVTIGENSCVETSSRNQFGGDITMSGTIPVVNVGVSSSFSWSTERGVKSAECDNETRSTETTLNWTSYNVTPYTKWTMRYIQYSGELSHVPVDSTARIHFKNCGGCSVDRPQKGFYFGGSYLKETYEFTDESYNVAKGECQ